MALHWVDVSIPLQPGITGWPGDPHFACTPKLRLENGDDCNTSWIAMSTHAGTHIDAPWHYLPEGQRLHEINPNLFFGNAQVIEHEGEAPITAAALPERFQAQRVLLKTKASQRPPTAPFQTDFPALTPDAADHLIQQGIHLVGIDALSVDLFDAQDEPVHHTLLRNSVIIVEGLRLGNISPGVYGFVVLPLPLRDADAAPCRAFIGVEEIHS